MTTSSKIKAILRSRSGLSLLLLLLHFGCGYRLARELSLPPHIKAIAVPIFENRTSEPDIEKPLTEAVIERLQAQEQFRITTLDQADAVLYGTVSTYAPRIPLGFNKLYQVKEYRLKFTAKLKLRDVKTDEVIWEGMLSAKTEYLVSADVLATQDAEKAAQEVAAFELARDLITMWEGF